MSGVGQPVSRDVIENAPRNLRELETLMAERDRLRAACRHVVENCYCQPSGQTCDVCHPAALALMEETRDA